MNSFFTTVLLFALLLAKINLSLAQGVGKAIDLALVGAKIYPSPTARPISEGTVLIQAGKIIAVGESKEIKVPSGMKVLDCKGLTLTAGFWNSHVHFIEPKWHACERLPSNQLNNQLQEMLTKYGFTYAFDLATLDLENLLTLRSKISKGEVIGPTIFTAGVPFSPPKGSPSYIAPLKLPEMTTKEEANKYVKGQFAAGADGIKVWSASPTNDGIVDMPLEVLKEASSVAHKQGKFVFAHPTNNTGVKTAIAGGVDVLVHTSPEDRKTWDEETINGMLRVKMALVPTLKLYKWELDRQGSPSENNPLINTAVQQLSQYSKAGGVILFGTDVGYMSDYNPTDEYVLMKNAGMSFLQILDALTLAPAAKFGHSSHTGSVVVGMDADIVLMKSDPELDVKSFSNVAYTLHQGRILFGNLD